jgi:YgiT-type zinc finger domain-containing protein
MTTERRHRCGGILVPQEVEIRTEGAGLVFVYHVPGSACQNCGEQLFSRNTAIEIETTRIPDAIGFSEAAVGTFAAIDAVRLSGVPSSSAQGMEAPLRRAPAVS